MKENIKEFIVFVLIWACLIWGCTFNPVDFWGWFKVEICLMGVTVFFWWIFDIKNHFTENEDENETA